MPRRSGPVKRVRLPARGWSAADGAAQTLRGVSHVSAPQWYPGDPLAADPSALPVCHFSHNVELAFNSDGLDYRGGVSADADTRRGAQPRGVAATPCAASHPVAFFRLVSYDEWDRTTVRGYAALRLDDSVCPGSCERKLKTWRPFGGALGGLREAFVGGGVSELADVAYVDVPPAWAEENAAAASARRKAASLREPPAHDPNARQLPPKALSRFGFQAESGGELKVRVCSAVQRHPHHAGPPVRRATRAERLGLVAEKAGAHAAAKSRAARRDLPARPLSLNAIVERAKLRLREAGRA